MKSRTVLGVLAASSWIGLGLFACGKPTQPPTAPSPSAHAPDASTTLEGTDAGPAAVTITDAGAAHRTRAPHITHGPVEIQGLPSEVVQRIVRQNTGRLRICYEKGLAQRPDLHGRITVKFETDNTGRVHSVVDDGSEFDDASVVECVRSTITNLSLPAPDGGVARGRYSWTFEPEPPPPGLTRTGFSVLTAPLWPTGTNQALTLVWVAHPSRGQGETATRDLELVARIGNVERRFFVGPQRGGLEPKNLSVCGQKQLAYKKGPGEIAKIVFGLAGHAIYVVKRSAPALLEISSIQGPDGYCPKNDCDTVQGLGKIVIPADAKVTESFVEVDATGKERPLACP